MPPKKYMTVEEGQTMLDTISALRASIETLGVELDERVAVSTVPEIVGTSSSLPTLEKLECYVYDGDAVVKMSFTTEREAVKAINSLRRKVMASGINVICGDTVTCFRHLTRVVFSAELARQNPLLMKG